MKLAMLLSAALLTAVLSPAGACAGEVSPAKLLPGDNDIEGWKRDGETLMYGPGNLWEYINGQAEAFLMYDFRGVAAQHYLGGPDREIKVEIYEHGSPLMTFGIYTQFRSPEGSYIDIGNEAFGDEYSLHFWKGRFYVKVHAYDEGEKSAEAMRMFAGIVAGSIPDEGGEPAEASLFPRGGLVEKSVTFVSEGVMGSGELPPAFTGDYAAGEEKGRLYIFPLESEEAAGEVFDRYAVGIGAAAGRAGSGKAEYSVAEGEAPYRGPVRAFAYGRFMGIVTGFRAGSKTAVSLVEETVSLIDGFCRAER